MEDVLKDRRTTSDWCWSLKHHTPPWYAFRRKPQLTSKDINEDVLSSQAVHHTIDQLAMKKGIPRSDLERDAVAIVGQMGHMFGMKTIRFFGLLLAKIFKRLYSSLDVNVDGLEAVRRVVPHRPIILMPTHRSYVDFLIVSYVFFHYDLPLPVIAAGQDFTSMKVMGSLMRQAGAFFIRRSFGGDRLYWALFAEYIATLVASGEAPVEFFVEGARSRSGKPIFPKYGLLASALEPYFKARVPDIAIVPIAISYDRTLEESLYVHEMLGVPKPKETTTGLLKAWKILGDSYGSIKMIVGEPISVMEFCGDRIDRSGHSLMPRHLSPITSAEREMVMKLAHHVLECHRKLLPIGPFVVIAAAARAAISMAIVQNSSPELPYHRLALDVRWLIELLVRLGAPVDWPLDRDPTEVIHEVCKIHENVVDITDVDSFKIRECQQQQSSILFHQPDFDGEVTQFSLTMNSAVGNLLLDHYGNQMLHVVVPEGILALVLYHGCTEASSLKEWVYSEYCFLEKVLQLEFVICEGNSSKNFDTAAAILTEFGALNEFDGRFTVNRDAKIVLFLAVLFEPFILGYRILCQELLDPTAKSSNEIQPSSAKDMAKRAQRLAMSVLTSVSGLRHQYASLSLELLTNGVHALHNMEAIAKEPATRDGISLYGPVHNKLLLIARRLDSYARFPFGNTLLSTDVMAKL